MFTLSSQTSISNIKSSLVIINAGDVYIPSVRFIPAHTLDETSGMQLNADLQSHVISSIHDCASGIDRYIHGVMLCHIVDFKKNTLCFSFPTH